MPQTASKRPLILVIDDEPALHATVRPWLEERELAVISVGSFMEAIRAAHRPEVAAAVVDYRLNEGDEGVRLGDLLLNGFGIPFVLITGFLDDRVRSAAMAAGAIGVLAKPLAPDRFTTEVERALLTKRTDLVGAVAIANVRSGDASPTHLCRAPLRWARMVMKTCWANEDPYTVDLWSEVIAMSRSTLETACGMCGVKPHDARDLGRFLRALAKNRGSSEPLRDLFASADDRTLKRLFNQAGLPLDSRGVSLQEFFKKQTFVRTSRPCLRELSHLAANSGLFD